MKLRNVDYAMIVRQKIALVQAGVKVDDAGPGGPLPGPRQRAQDGDGGHRRPQGRHRPALEAPPPPSTWPAATCSTPSRPASIPKVIDCPDPAKGRPTLDGVCRNGIQLKAKARVTVRTKLDRLVGGATEETIIARVGEGIVKAIGSAEHHKDVLANPNLISQAVLQELARLADGVRDRVDRRRRDRRRREHRRQAAGRPAPADLRVAQAEAEKRRAAAVAREQEMKAVVENRAKVVLAEAEVPLAIAEAFRKASSASWTTTTSRTCSPTPRCGPRSPARGNATQRDSARRAPS